MRRQTFNVLFFIKRTRLLKNGNAPIRMRITLEGKATEIQIKRGVPPHLWSQAKGRSTGRDRASVELNSYLDLLRVKVFQIQQDLEFEGKAVNLESVKKRFIGEDDTRKTLYAAFREHNDRCRQLIGTDFSDITVRRYETCLRYVMELMQIKFKHTELLLREVDAAFLREFEFFLKTNKNCQQNTTVRYMICLKKIIIQAFNDGLIPQNPFASIRLKVKEVEKEFLTQEELLVIMKKEFDIPRLGLVRDIFIFCCFSGLAFVDVYQLKPEHIVQDTNGKMWIRKPRQKTKNMCNIPLLTIPAVLIEKYKDHPLCQNKNVVLPVMCNQKMNSYLKEIADFCGIKKNLTTHVARFTFATTVALGNNVSLPNVAKMLGHSNIRMTQHYAKALDQNIYTDMVNVEKHFSDAI